MKLAIVGTGYVGLVTGTCFADSGNQVACVDIDEAKVARLNGGEIPIYEPGLEEMVRRNRKAGRLKFTTDLAAAVAGADMVFLAVGTPSAADGSADLSALWAAAETMAPHLSPQTISVIKSTVPVGTNEKLYQLLNAATGRECDVASNPEFLKEGAAIEDFTKPDRVVVGVRREAVAERLRKLYAPFLRTENPFLVMSPESAEMTKYVANALLSTKISFINEVAGLCAATRADVDDVRRGIGHDQRIGFAFLFPGVGYGGSCFPKDVRALAQLARENDIEPRILSAVDATNEAQKRVVPRLVEKHFNGDLSGKTIAVWGLAFKPRTDDIREAPALTLIDAMLAAGARVQVHDPEAMANVRAVYGDKLHYAEQPMEAAAGADALAVMTEWSEFRRPDFGELRGRMRGTALFDGRNIFNHEEMQSLGFTYYSIGRRKITPTM